MPLTQLQGVIIVAPPPCVLQLHIDPCCRGTPPRLPSEKRNLERLQRSLHKTDLGRSPADAQGRLPPRGQLPGASVPASLTPSCASSFCAPVCMSSGDDNLKVLCPSVALSCPGHQQVIFQ